MTAALAAAPTSNESPLSVRDIVEWFRRLMFFSGIGLVLIVTNFPKFLTRLVEANITGQSLRTLLVRAIDFVQAVLHAFIGREPVRFFERTMSCNFFLLSAFLILLAMFSIRRRGVPMLLCGLGGILLGYLALHVIAWAAVIVVVTIRGTIYVARAVAWAVSEIAAFVFQYTWPIFAALIVVGLAIIAFQQRNLLLQWLIALGQLLRRYAVWVVGAASVIWALTILVPAFYRWVLVPLWNLLVFLLTPIGFVLGWIITILGVAVLAVLSVMVLLISMALVGSLLVTQLQAGWHAARSVRYMLVAGFAIGSALALIVLQCIATPALSEALNQAWINVISITGVVDRHLTTQFVTGAFQLTLPETVRDFAYANLTHLQAPALDSFIFLVVISLASLSLLLRVFSAAPLDDVDVPMNFVVKEYAIMAGGIFIGLLLIFAAAMTGDSKT